MKLSTTASSICLAAAASAPSRFANAAVCGELISKLETLRLAAVAAKIAYEEKSIELDACQVSTPAPIPPTPAPTLPPILSSILLRTPAPMVPLTPAPVLPPTPWPTLPATPGPTAAAADDDDDGRFQIVKGQSWNYNLDTPVNIEDVDVDIYFIDMDGAQSIIDTLHSNNKGVVCYINIGSWEEWRGDADQFPKEAIGSSVSGWPGEKWLDINNEQVRMIMTARVHQAAGMGCDAIEPDNSMVYAEAGTGVNVSEAEQIAYNIWFAELVHSLGMSVGLKNSVEIVGDLVSYFDFALNEECHDREECDVYIDTFLYHNKPVFNIEYNLGKTMCESANALGLDTIVKDYDLDATFCSCVDDSRDFECAKVL